MNPTAPDLTPTLFRIATDERFFANLYWAWCGGKLDLDAVATELRAPAGAVVRAGLCFRPRSGHAFTADVEKIARYAGIEVEPLLGLIRTAEALAVLNQTPGQDRFLAAARDARPDDDDD